MYKDRKLIISEYSTLFDPTGAAVVSKMEKLFEIDQSGWKGKYFRSLDTAAHNDIPSEITRAYRNFTGRPFDFEDVPGVVLAHSSGIVLVLEEGEHLDLPFPVINTGTILQEAYNLPSFMPYMNWFEITFSQAEKNILAYYKLHTSGRGDSLLRQYGLPANFPAVIGDPAEGLRYYFCGDFSRYKAGDKWCFKGLPWVAKLYNDLLEPRTEERFFWSYYYPLMSGLLEKGRVRPSLTEERMLPAESDYIPYSIEAGNIELLPGNEGTGISEAEELLKDKEEERVPTQVVADRTKEKGSNSLIKSGMEFRRERYQVGGRLPYRVWMDIKEGRRTANYRTSSADRGVVPVSENLSGEKKWYIVLASLRSAGDASQFAQKVNYPDVKVVYVDYVNSNRVILGSYGSLRDAQEQFEEVVREYPEAWMVRF